MAPTIGAGTTEAAALQSEIQNELMRRDKAEQGDNTLAEYITVMLINHKTSDQINEELADLQGIDFDPTFTPWIFEKAEEVVARFTGSSSTPAPVTAVPSADVSMEEPSSSSRNSKAPSNARLFSNAVAPLASQPTRPTPTGPSGQVAGVKRSFSPVNEMSGSEAYNKRRSLGSGGVPTAPRAHRQNGLETNGDRHRGKRSLLDRMGGPPLNPQAAEFGPGRAGGRNHFGPPGMPMMDPFMMSVMGMQNGFNFGAAGGQDQAMMQEMFRQNQATMEQMQAMMMQMAQQMGTVPQQPYTTTISGQPPQQLGKHTIAGRRPATLVNNPSTSATHKSTSFPAKKTLVTPPSRPTSQEICKYGVGCTNRSCGYSHPSPVATMESGMVLKTEACPEGLKCADKDCPYSHVSPAQSLGDAAGQSRVPCKFGSKCNNPACSFRHEDAAGNPIPTPALTRPANGSSTGPIDVDMADPTQHDELDITLDLDSSAAGMAASRLIAGVPGKKMDGILGSGVVKPMNGQIKVPCRFGEGCTRGNCRFQHGKACRFGKKCFDPRCTFVHPADRQLNASINNDGFNNYKGEKTLVDREFVKDESAVETVLPGGLNGAEEGGAIKVETD